MSIDLPESLIGQIVWFKIYSLELVLKVDTLEPDLQGQIVASSKNDSAKSEPCIELNYFSGRLMTNSLGIKEYRILTKRDLPLLIGYEYTTELLQELLAEK